MAVRFLAVLQNISVIFYSNNNGGCFSSYVSVKSMEQCAGSPETGQTSHTFFSSLRINELCISSLHICLQLISCSHFQKFNGDTTFELIYLNHYTLLCRFSSHQTFIQTKIDLA